VADAVVWLKIVTSSSPVLSAMSLGGPCSSSKGCIYIQGYAHTLGKIKVKGHGDEDLFPSACDYLYVMEIWKESCFRADLHSLFR